MPAFPLLADAASYRACMQDLLADGVEVRRYWLDLFERHITTLADLPVGEGLLEDRPEWPAFREDYLSGLAELRAEPHLRGCLTVLELTRFREEKFAAHGIDDPFADLKRRENELALRALPDVLRDVESCTPRQRGEHLARGMFAGNLFDMGSKAAVDAFCERGFDFFAERDRVRPRPWPVDDLDGWLDRTFGRRPAYRQALFFVDNAGPDIVLGAVPFVRNLAAGGTRVVLAANSRPALNDITARELWGLLEECGQLDRLLAAQLREERVSVVVSGGDAPLIDLSDLTQACCAAAAESDLLILEGMGRAIESNYDTRFTVDTLKIALIKDEMVASVLGVGLFDPVFRFEGGRA